VFASSEKAAPNAALSVPSITVIRRLRWHRSDSAPQFTVEGRLSKNADISKVKRLCATGVLREQRTCLLEA